LSLIGPIGAVLIASACGSSQAGDGADSFSSGGSPGAGGQARAGGSAIAGIANGAGGSGGSEASVGGAPLGAGGSVDGGGMSAGASAGAVAGGSGVPAGGATGTAGANGGGGTTAGTANGGAAAGAQSGSGGGAGAAACVPAEKTDAATNVRVDAAKRYQVFEGWGTSLCWFGNVVGGFQEANRTAIADRLFDPAKGLGLNVVRYNIGGGDAPSHDHMGAGKEMPVFKASATSAYDWNADANQVWMLNAARSRIPAGQFIAEAFSNSPPYWMTVSGCSSGATDGGNNLKSDQYDDFAEFLSEVVLHFKNTHGISFRTLEPFNEPASDWWKAQGAQEGCGFDRASQSQLIGLVRSSLDAKGLTGVGIAASDETSIDLAVDTYNALTPAARAQVVQINTHAYSGSKRAELLALATRDNKRIWSSEIDGSGAPAPFDVYPHNHSDIVPGLDLANRITRDLKELRSHAWVFWQAVENEQAQVSLNKNWGLLHTDFTGGDQAALVTKKYHAFSQYTRAIRPGYQQLDIGHTEAVAFFGSGTLVIVQRNAANSDATFTYDLGSFASVGAQATVHRTSASEDYAALPARCISEKKLVATVARQSITTFVIPGVAL
ncbi:MAG TPA: glycoside hydrolase, partial [Polyangiaceae bacterium]